MNDAAAPKRAQPSEARGTRWAMLTARAFAELETCDPLYRPTNFWGPGLDQLLDDMNRRGLPRFKRWPSASFWFLPRYGNGLGNDLLDAIVESAQAITPRIRRETLRNSLRGMQIAQRDFDAAQLAWDQSRWPADLTGIGESSVGMPTQHFRLVPENQEVRFGRAYLNYMLMMSALSRHIDGPPTSVLELGGGAGNLGEFLMSRDEEVRYVNLDLPPLLTVSSFYLSRLFGDRVLTYDDRVPAHGPIEVPRSAVLPNWRIEDLTGPFDVAVNSFSFQEMEPDVVAHYAARIADLDARWVVSLNSRAGKPKASADRTIGVVDPVTSARIVEIFAKHGYELEAAYNRPLLRSAGELVILKRR